MNITKRDTQIIIAEMESIFADIVRTAHPNSWNENHISYLLMERMQAFFNEKSVKFPGWRKIVDWRSFKNSGSQETENSDIAIMVNIQISDGGILKGIACLEAKRTYPSGNFDQLSQPQLERIYANRPHSQLLLYTHDKLQIPFKFPNTINWSSNMWVTSVNTAKVLLSQIGRANNRILRTSFPFSIFLMSRIFWGQDLHYDDEPYNDIIRGMDRIGEFRPTFLGIANIYYEGQRPVDLFISDLWDQIGRQRPRPL